MDHLQVSFAGGTIAKIFSDLTLLPCYTVVWGISTDTQWLLLEIIYCENGSCFGFLLSLLFSISNISSTQRGCYLLLFIGAEEVNLLRSFSQNEGLDVFLGMPSYFENQVGIAHSRWGSSNGIIGKIQVGSSSFPLFLFSSFPFVFFF